MGNDKSDTLRCTHSLNLGLGGVLGNWVEQGSYHTEIVKNLRKKTSVLFLRFRKISVSPRARSMTPFFTRISVFSVLFLVTTFILKTREITARILHSSYLEVRRGLKS
jgi:hypothetical protein